MKQQKELRRLAEIGFMGEERKETNQDGEKTNDGKERTRRVERYLDRCTVG